MKIDLLYELQMPKPWKGPDAEQRLFWESLEQIQLADRAGFDTIWCVEHHFQTEYAHSSAPEVFLSAVSQRTERIRIGHGVVLLPYPFNHPIRVAERIATLDILSRGRVEFGTGRSGLHEQGGFEIPAADSRAMWQEAAQIIPQMWMNERFSCEGRFFHIPEREIIPKPVQKPHPPMWLACTSPDSWLIAAQNRIGALGLTLMLSVEEMQTHVQRYRAAQKDGKPVGAFANDQARVFTIVHCAETNKKAMDQGGGEAALWYLGYILDRLLKQELAEAEKGGARPYSQFVDRYKALKGHAGHGLRPETFADQDMIITGDPDTCIRKLERYEQSGVDGVLCLMQAGRIKHPDVMRSIELFGKHVIPHFKAKGAKAKKQTALR